MEIILERCAGLDVHQASVVCCVLIGAPGRKTQKLLRSFGTTTRELEALRAWLAEHGVTHVGMESTGVYWKPVYAVLEGHFDLIVGNAHHVKNVPGRKTDVKDAEWIAQLVRHGLVAKSFVPPPAIRDLRELVRRNCSPPLCWMSDVQGSLNIADRGFCGSAQRQCVDLRVGP